MFLQNLNPYQQDVFLSLANEMVAADGVFATEEKELLERMKLQMHSKVSSAAYQHESLPDIFATKAASATVMLELIGLGYADEVLDPKEKSFLEKVRDTLAVSAEEFEDMESWVLRQFSLIRQANEFMMED